MLSVDDDVYVVVGSMCVVNLLMIVVDVVLVISIVDDVVLVVVGSMCVVILLLM